MPKIKLTKSELKSQRDALKQFTRFLPTLQLKKQQLQLETRKSQDRVDKNRAREETFKHQLKDWIALFGDAAEVDEVVKLIEVEGVDVEPHNIAGVDIPVYKTTRFKVEPYDLFAAAPWFDDAVQALRDLVEIKAERAVLQEQYRRISRELRVTTQRVNLFEKVKIPECKENIRVIQIYLSDQQTAAVGRSKIAKRKMEKVA